MVACSEGGDANIETQAKSPNPLANHVNESMVNKLVTSSTPIACFSCNDTALLHVAHLKSLSGVYGWPVYIPN